MCTAVLGVPQLRMQPHLYHQMWREVMTGAIGIMVPQQKPKRTYLGEYPIELVCQPILKKFKVAYKDWKHEIKRNEENGKLRSLESLDWEWEKIGYNWLISNFTVPHLILSVLYQSCMILAFLSRSPKTSTLLNAMGNSVSAYLSH